MKYTFKDIEILDEEKVELEIGKKKKIVVLEMLTIKKYYDVFIPKFLEFLQYFKMLGKSLELPSYKDKDWKDKDFMNDLIDKIRQVMSYENARKEFIKLLKKIGCLKMSRAYFEKYVKPTELISIFLYVYKFNIDGVKKKLDEAETEILGVATSQVTPNSTGLQLKKGGLREKLPARYPRLAT